MIDWINGDLLDLEFPAHTQALRNGGKDFLTNAFRAAGALAADNRVTQISQFEECNGGSTGRKLLLSVAYETPVDNLHTALFVKFSRDFDDAIRDRARFQMEAEVRFGMLSRGQDFPIAVPVCYYADFHRESGSGILITERIPFGTRDIEQHYAKCLDYEIPDQLEHYRALIRALARLAGTHKSGRLGDDVDRHFPFDASALVVSPRQSYTTLEIEKKLAGYAEFANVYARLLPQNIRSATFIARLVNEAPRLVALQPRIMELLAGDQRYIALCHWNAKIDNAWFKRRATGLECGLLDWGHVSQMSIAMSLWGCLSGAETALWDQHLDELLTLYVTEFQHAGGAHLDTLVLKNQLTLYAALMGLNWLLDVPPYLVRRFPDLSDFESRCDAQLKQHEAARAQLQMMTVFLNVWQTTDMITLIQELEIQIPAQ